jgi:hypothetical protein
MAIGNLIKEALCEESEIKLNLEYDVETLEFQKVLKIYLKFTL